MFHPPCRSLCVCVCAQPSPALSRSLLEVSTGPGRCCQTSQCGSSPALGVVLNQILAPRLIPAFPTPFGAGFVFFLLSPCRSGCCTQTCERGAGDEGNWFVLALNRTSACIRFPSDLSLMALAQTGSAHPHAVPLTAIPQEATRVPSELRSQSEFCLLFPHVCP